MASIDRQEKRVLDPNSAQAQQNAAGGVYNTPTGPTTYHVGLPGVMGFDTTNPEAGLGAGGESTLSYEDWLAQTGGNPYYMDQGPAYQEYVKAKQGISPAQVTVPQDPWGGTNPATQPAAGAGAAVGPWLNKIWETPWGGQEIYDTTYADLQRREQEAIAAAQGHPANAMMLELAQGRGAAIDAAQAQLRAGLDAANAAAASQAASARGGAGARALASRGAAMGVAQSGQRAANEASAMRAQMALGGLEGIARQRAEDMTMRGNFANTGAGIGQAGMQGAGGHTQAQIGATGNLLGIASGHELGLGDLDIRGRVADTQRAALGAQTELGISEQATRAGTSGANIIGSGMSAGTVADSLLPRKPYGEE